jgi:cyanuric acid amidohydrolase
MKTTAIRPIRLPMRAPDDLAGFAKILDGGTIDPADIVGLWCKTRGNGLRNDFTKPWIDLLLRSMLAKRLGVDDAAIAEQVPILVSGGSEGLVSPHLVIWTKGQASGERGLLAGVSRIEVAPADHGTAKHRDATARQLADLMAASNWRADDVGLVIVRAPSNFEDPAADPAVRKQTALGVAQVLDGKDAAFASRAFVVARHDGPGQQIFVLANGAGGDPAYAVSHAVLADPLDSPSVAAALAKFGFAASPQLPPDQSKRLIAAISKGDAPANGTIRGMPHAMNLDNDIAMHRHSRAAYGAMIGSTIGHGAVLVSGGAEAQGPEDGGFASFVAQVKAEGSKV